MLTLHTVWDCPSVLGLRFDSNLLKHEGQPGKLGFLYRQGDDANRG